MAPHTPFTTFITGATGFLGSELLRRLVSREPTTQVYVLIRAVDASSAGERLDALLDELFTVSEPRAQAGRRVHAVHGDVRADRLGLEPAAYQALAEGITDIYHLASDVRFNLPLEEARAINVQGASNVLELALASARIRGKARVSLHHVSTYAVGRPAAHGEPVYEALTLQQGSFHNTYEQSKAETEHMLVERAGNVRLYIYRPSVIVGDSRTGWTQDFKVSYLLMRSYFSYASALPLLLAEGGHVDQVNIDYVADALLAVSRSTTDCSGTIYHLVTGEHAMRSSQVFTQFAEALRELAIAQNAAVVPPSLQVRLTEAVTEDDLRATISDPAVLKLMLEFAPYFGNAWIYDDANTQRVLARLPGPSRLQPEVNVGVLAGYCMRTQWGRRREQRPALAVESTLDR